MPLRRRFQWLAAATGVLMAPIGGSHAEGLLGAPPKDAPAIAAAPPADLASPVLPDSPIAAVKPFYEHIGLELDAAERDRFVDPARKVLDDNDTLQKSGQGDCLDPNMALDNAAYDKAAIDASLKMQEAVKEDEAKVIVAFVVADTPHRLEWKLRKVGGQWKIADLLSVTGEWALSQYQCQ